MLKRKIFGIISLCLLKQKFAPQFEMPAGFLFVFIHLMKMIFQKYQETIIIH